MVEDVECSGKAFDASSRALRHCGQASQIGRQEMHDPIGLRKVDAAKQDPFGRKPGHAVQSIGAEALAAAAGAGTRSGGASTLPSVATMDALPDVGLSRSR